MPDASTIADRDHGASLDRTLATHAVFGLLDAADRAGLGARFRLVIASAGEVLADGAQLRDALALILRGQVTLQRGADGPSLRLEAGALLGAGAGPHDRALDWQVQAVDEVRLAWLPAAEVSRLVAGHPLLAFHLATPAPTSTPATDAGQASELGLLGRPIGTLLRRQPLMLGPEATIGEAARAMRDERSSSVLIVEDGHLLAIATDRDLRNRALADGVDPGEPLRSIATAGPETLEAGRPTFDALLLMARRNVHHVPVTDRGRIVGMLSASDLTEQHSSSAVFMVGEIREQRSVDGLVAAAAKVKSLQQGLVAADATAYATGHVVTAITDAITVRLLELAEAGLGPPPVPYAWVVAGSQARQEQTARSDQDNCLILDDAYRADTHGAYFLALAMFVNDGLDRCGYVYCPGEMMARTDGWRQPLATWREYFRRWTDQPDPQALMLTSVFFDLRLVHGEAELLEGLQAQMLRCTRGNELFLGHMVHNALTRRAPLTMFGGIATSRHGALRDAVNLKHQGIVPIVDLARVYALAGGDEVANTHDRLQVAAGRGAISEQSARDLRDALEFLSITRIRHQAAQIARGEPPDNFLSLAELGNFERSQLRDAFGVVRTLQSVLGQRYR